MKNMSTHQQIIDILEKGPVTISMLHKKTRLAKGGITSRISELRKKGYNIQNIDNHYVMSTDTKIEKKIEEWINRYTYFNRRIDYAKIAKELDLSLDEIKDGMQRLFHKYKIIQISNTSVIVKQQ